jgi:hypothetical protein
MPGPVPLRNVSQRSFAIFVPARHAARDRSIAKSADECAEFASASSLMSAPQPVILIFRLPSANPQSLASPFSTGTGRLRPVWVGHTGGFSAL